MKPRGSVSGKVLSLERDLSSPITLVTMILSLLRITCPMTIRFLKKLALALLDTGSQVCTVNSGLLKGIFPVLRFRHLLSI